MNLTGPPLRAAHSLLALEMLSVVAEAIAAASKSTRILNYSAPTGVAGDGLGSGSCANLVADCDNALSARTDFEVKSDVLVEGRAAVGNGCRGKCHK